MSTFCVSFVAGEGFCFPDDPRFRGVAVVDMPISLEDWRSSRSRSLVRLVETTIDLGCNAGPEMGVHA